MDKETLYKNRSFSSCILAAYKLMGENIKTILSSTWLPFLLLAVFSSIAFVINIPHPAITSFALSHPLLTLIIWAACLLASIVCEIWAFARLSSMLNEKPRRWNFIRMALLWLNNLVIGIVVGGIIATLILLALRHLGCSPIKFIVDNWLLLTVAAVVVTLLFLPLIYINMRYIFNDGARYWADFPKSYKRGLRHLGLIFLTVLISGIICGIIVCVIFLPLFILQTALFFSSAGQLMGDAPGLPGYFPWLLGITFALTILLTCYVVIFQFIIQTFMYGSIEKQREERRETITIEENPSTPH